MPPPRSPQASAAAPPPPDADAAAHSARVAAMLREAIAAAGGWIPFARYMELALYAPGLGYYSAGATKFGAAGDFVTAPEISPLFCEAVAAQLGEALRALRGGTLLELGPGTGRFAGIALRTLAAAGSLPERYELLEVGADLRERQRGMLAQLAGPAAQRAHWLERLPGAARGVIFGNEVLDALPCERFVIRDGQALRLGVALDAAGAFAWRARVADGGADGDADFARALARRLPAELRAQLDDGYCGELQVQLGAWFAALAAALREGLIVLADYGLPRAHYYHPQRGAGTLRCHYRHRAHDDPFSWPGLTDITSWVDFTAVAEAADAAGFEVAGFCTQAAFLLGAGIEARLAAASEGADERGRATLAHGVRQLLLPGEMGESVKFIVLARGTEVELPALRLQDLRRSL